MKLERARSKILDLWRNQKNTCEKDDYTTFFQSVRSFYDNIKRNNKELLSFNHLGDKWQVVNRWIHEYENEGQLNS